MLTKTKKINIVYKIIYKIKVNFCFPKTFLKDGLLLCRPSLHLAIMKVESNREF